MSFSELAGWAGLVIGIVLAVLLVVQTVRLGRIEQQYRALMKGTGAGKASPSLGELISMQGARLDNTYTEVASLRQAVGTLNTAVSDSVQKVGLVRYNPFGDVGGDQSFSLALLDAHGNGVVISSLHGRTATRFYAKPIAGGTSPASLSEEETQAVSRAMGNG